MHEYHNSHTNERYVVRVVPFDEAKRLQDAGAIFYDNTKLVAVNTCPTFGVLRYALHRTETSLGGRNLAIECGSACHDFFAAIRMWTLVKKHSVGEILDNAVYDHGKKLFGEDRWESMLSIPQDSDDLHNAINFALDALHSTGYYDDPNDKKRTMANMEVACITYANRYFQDNLPVYVKDDFIGVEVPFVMEIERSFGHEIIAPQKYYFCGRVDGVHEYGSTVTAGENKTASRPDDVWRMSFHTSTQVTGYNIALSCILRQEVSDSLIMGVQIPVPARDIYSGIAFEPIRRSLDDKLRWFEWFFHGVSSYERWADPITAPRYTHSCNRYYSICQFLPFCTMTREEQREVLENMRVDQWSPLDHIVESAEPVIE